MNRQQRRAVAKGAAKAKRKGKKMDQQTTEEQQNQGFVTANDLLFKIGDLTVQVDVLRVRLARSEERVQQLLSLLQPTVDDLPSEAAVDNPAPTPISDFANTNEGD